MKYYPPKNKTFYIREVYEDTYESINDYVIDTMIWERRVDELHTIWMKGTSNAPVLPYNTLVHNQTKPMKVNDYEIKPFSNLTCANLRGSILRGSTLRGADLTCADLRGADLLGVYLKDAILKRANLRGANFKNADLRDADLRGADFYNANLQGANLEGAILDGADVTGTILDKEEKSLDDKDIKIQQLEGELKKYKDTLKALLDT